MPRGTPKHSPWVQVPKLKMPGMCSLCGRQGKRFVGPLGGVKKFERYCAATDKSCRASAMRCAGPFIMEHKVAKLIAECCDEEQDND